MIFKILSNLSGNSKKDLKIKANQLGDLSLLAFEVNLSAGSSILIEEAYASLKNLSGITGNNSAARKEDELNKLFQKSSGLEAKYLIRLIEKSLKIGASDITVIESLANAVETTPPNQQYPHKSRECQSILQKSLEKSIKVCPDFTKIIQELLKITPESHLESSLNSCSSIVGNPIQPMTAHPVKEISEILERFQGNQVTCEFKYDGMRGQIHIQGDKVWIFSRGSENITSSYPDICQAVLSSKSANVKELIVDCEIIPIDPETNLPKPFSELQTRKRKSVEINDIKVPVAVKLFDLLFLNNSSLLDHPFSSRRSLLTSSFVESKFVQFVEFKNLQNFEEILIFLEEAVNKGCEGLMIKSFSEDSSYDAGSRSLKWLKLKKDYIGKDLESSVLPDSLDLTPIGGFYGSGKRKGIFGSYLLASFDTERQEYQTVCKIGTGFSDSALKDMSSQLKVLQVVEKMNDFRVQMKPDVWFKPELVWEVQAADLSVSPIHTSAWNKPSEGKGISIRFPRFLRSRTDKNVSQVTTSQEIFKYFLAQKGRNKLI
jgi:DNA ligase-1